MIDDLKDKYSALDSKQKLRSMQVIGATALVALFYLAYMDRVEVHQIDVIETDQEQIENVVVTDAELFENDISEEVDEKLLETQQELQNLKELFDLSMANNSNLNPQFDTDVVNDNLNDSGLIEYGQSYPPPPIVNNAQSLNQSPENINIQPQWIGGIVHEEYESPIIESALNVESEKKRTIKLPPSFMEGFLLTGMDAMTVESSNDTPEPMMIRVQAPAVLPNEVKANLKGCFVIAEGYGSLATHRVDARLRSISCVDYKGGSVIYEKISGYIQDSDGKRGIKGQVVHRAGQAIARSMIAGAFQGIGDAMTGSAQTNNISAIGQTTTTPSSNLGSAALGGGISSAAKDIGSLFLQLAKQSSPVIEVGAAKKVSVVITKLVELHIEDL